MNFLKNLFATKPTDELSLFIQTYESATKNWNNTKVVDFVNDISMMGKQLRVLVAKYQTTVNHAILVEWTNVKNTWAIHKDDSPAGLKKHFLPVYAQYRKAACKFIEEAKQQTAQYHQQQIQYHQQQLQQIQ